MKVTLIAHTPAPEKTVACAARVCYSKNELSDLMEGMTDEKAAGFVDMLAEIGHESPIEHASFTFAVEGVSRALLAQLTRHRIASYSVRSQRYVRAADFGYVTPPEIAKNPAAQKAYIDAMQASAKAYETLADLLKEQHTADLTAAGMDSAEAAKKAEKMAIEDARFVLPNACETQLVVTMNARSLQNFFAHRLCNRAQWEIRQLADLMLREVLKVAPHLFKNAGPSCVAHGSCPEGKMACGKIREVKAYFAKLREA